MKERRNNSSHSEFLQRLEERIELIEFESLTKQSLVSHLFIEDSDYEMTRITTELLAKSPGGNLDELRTLVKTTESSNWYKPGIKERANRVMQDGNGAGDSSGGGRWCSNCRTSTHNTSLCWGKCFSCGLYGHKYPCIGSNHVNRMLSRKPACLTRTPIFAQQN